MGNRWGAARHQLPPTWESSRSIRAEAAVPRGTGVHRAGWVWPLRGGEGSSPPLPARPTPLIQGLTRWNFLQFPGGPATEDSPWGCFTCCCLAPPPTLGHIYGHQRLSQGPVRSGCSVNSW